MPIRLLLIGNAGRAEMRPLVDWMSAKLVPAEFRQFRGFHDAINDLFASRWIPDLAVVLQSWSDEFSSSDLQQLINAAPLVRVAVCFGAWCESDGRTRTCWPLAVRVPVHSARARLSQEWSLFEPGSNCTPLPMSASREEMFAADHIELPICSPTDSAEESCVHQNMPAPFPSPDQTHTRTASLPRRKVMVDSPDPAYEQYLIELLTNSGCDASRVGFNDASSCDVVLVDYDPPSPARTDRVTLIREALPIAKIVLLTNSPFQKAVETESGNCIDAILPKPGDQGRIVAAVLSETIPR